MGEDAEDEHYHALAPCKDPHVFAIEAEHSRTGAHVAAENGAEHGEENQYRLCPPVPGQKET